jgi:hypothetical protein
VTAAAVSSSVAGARPGARAASCNEPAYLLVRTMTCASPLKVLRLHAGGGARSLRRSSTPRLTPAAVPQLARATAMVLVPGWSRLHVEHRRGGASLVGAKRLPLT